MLKSGSIAVVPFHLFLLFLFLTMQHAGNAQQEMEKTDKMVMEHRDHILKTPKNIEWMEGPESLPKGTKIAVLEGDLTKAEPFTFRAKIPAGWEVLPHFHPGVEHVTVLSGSLYMGFGDIYDESNAVKLPSGGFAVMQEKVHHYAFTKEETEIQVHSIGPWGITYLNPADNPINKQASK